MLQLLETEVRSQGGEGEDTKILTSRDICPREAMKESEQLHKTAQVFITT